MKQVLPVLILLNGLLLPCGCLPISMWLNPSLTTALEFTADLHITNATGEVRWVTPIGAVGKQGTRSPLFHVREAPHEWSSQLGGFEVLPGATLTLLYDWDDINLAEIVIENAENALGQLVADPQPTQGQYRPPTPNTFVISDFAALTPVSPNTLQAFLEAKEPPSIFPRAWLLLWPWVTFPLLLLAWFVRHRRREPSP